MFEIELSDCLTVYKQKTMYFSKIELFEIDLFSHLTVCKQKTVFEPMTNSDISKDCTYAKLNCLKISENI